MSGVGACAPVVLEPEEAVPDCDVVDVPQLAAADGDAAEALDCRAPAEVPLLAPMPGVRPWVADALSVVCEPLPSVPWLPCWGALLPPFSTFELAWMIAWRKGCTPSDTLAMTAIPARTTTGRSHPMFQSGTARAFSPSPACGISRNRGNGRPAGRGSPSGQAQ